MGVLRNELSKELDKQYQYLLVFKDNFNDIYEYCKNNFNNQTPLELVENIQINFLNNIIFDKQDNSYILNVFNRYDYDCFDEEVLERLLNINLEQSNANHMSFMDTFIYDEACYNVLEDDCENEDLIEKNEHKIQEVEDKLWNIYLNNIDNWNNELKYINIKLDTFNNIIGIEFLSNICNKLQKIIDDIDDESYSSIFLFISNALDCVYEENPKQYYDKYIEKWETSLNDIKESIIDADKKVENLKRNIEKEIQDVDNGLEEYGWLIEEN